jgi:hypothetical protein
VEAVVGHHDRFNPVHMAGGLLEPGQHRVLFMARGASHATDAIAFRQLGLDFDNLGGGGGPSIQHWAVGCRAGALTRPTLIPLLTVAGPTKLECSGVMALAAARNQRTRDWNRNR